MSLFHVLLAVGLALGRVRARLKAALVHLWSGVVLVVDVTVAFLLSGPTMLMVLAFGIRALPWTRMSLLVLGQVAGTLELFVAYTARVHHVSRLLRLASASHGAVDIIVIHVFVVDKMTLGRWACLIDEAVLGEWDHLSIFCFANKFGWLAVLAQTTFDGYSLIRAVIHLIQILTGSLLFPCSGHDLGVSANLLDKIEEVVVSVRPVGVSSLIALG